MSNHIIKIKKHEASFRFGKNINKKLLLADNFLADHPNLLFWTERNESKKGLFYAYREGVYLPISNLEVEEILANYEPADPKILMPSSISDSQLQETMRYIKRKRFFYRDVFNQENIINFKNGFLDIVTGELLPHSPEIVSTVQLPYSYTKDDTCPLFIKTINGIFEKDYDKVNILQEFMGYCLTKSTKYEKALFMIGAAQSGKSTIIETIQSMLGEDNVSNISLPDLGNPSFAGGLIDKYANLVSEIPKNVRNYEDQLESIISGERLTINTKFVPTYTARPFCKLIFAANDMPRISDTSDAIFRRMLLLEFDTKIEDSKVDVDLKRKLKNEYSGVFNWAFEGLQRLNENKKFTKSRNMTRRIKQLKIKNNTTLYFLEENYITDNKNENFVYISEVYREYVSFCKDIGARPLYINNFSEEVRKIYVDDIVRGRKYRGNRQEQVLYGIRKIAVGDKVHTEEDDLTNIISNAEEILWED